MTQYEFYMHMLNGILMTAGAFGLALAILLVLLVLWFWVFL